MCPPALFTSIHPHSLIACRGNDTRISESAVRKQSTIWTRERRSDRSCTVLDRAALMMSCSFCKVRSYRNAGQGYWGQFKRPLTPELWPGVDRVVLDQRTLVHHQSTEDYKDIADTTSSRFAGLILRFCWDSGEIWPCRQAYCEEFMGLGSNTNKHIYRKSK